MSKKQTGDLKGGNKHGGIFHTDCIESSYNGITGFCGAVYYQVSKNTCVFIS